MLTGLATCVGLGLVIGALLVAGVWVSVQWWEVLGLVLGDEEEDDPC